MLYNIVLVSAVQSGESVICIYIYIYSLALESPSPATHPTPLGHHRALS